MEQYDGQPWIARDMEKELLSSFTFSFKQKGYWIKGLRQVGKTALMTKFGKDHFRKTFVIDCAIEEQRKNFERELSAAVSVIGGSAFDKRYASLALKKCLPGFEDLPDEFLLIDEIQDSKYLHNMARWIVRGLDAKVCFCGSFLGDVLKWEDVKYAAGDVRMFELLPVAFSEVVRSVDSLEGYRAVRDFTRSNPDEALRKVLHDAKLYWDIFYGLGGFPLPLRAVLEEKSMEEAIASRDSGLNSLIQTVARKTRGNLSYSEWQQLLGYTVHSLISHEDPTNLDNLRFVKRKDEVPAIISESLVSDLIRWMEGSGILTRVPVITSLDDPNPYIKSKYMFTNFPVLCKFVDVGGKTTAIGRTPIGVQEVQAETFVLNELLGMSKFYKVDSLAKYRLDDLAYGEEVDFAFMTREGARVLVEVKGKGETLSSNRAMARGEADYLIKFIPGTGFVRGNAFALPMWHIDRLPVIIRLIDIAYTNKITLEDAYGRYASGIDDDIAVKPPWQPDDADIPEEQ
jgi:predicted AAA+ superfamily ATPase